MEKSEKLSGEFSIKLRFIQVLEIAPTFLISKIREMRNKLEHEYILPSQERAKEAIEIAELFINATQNKIFKRFITDYVVQNEYKEDDDYIKVPSYSIRFDLDKCEIGINYLTKNNETGLVTINATEEEYIYFIKAAISCDFYYLVKAFGVDIDRKYISYQIKQF